MRVSGALAGVLLVLFLAGPGNAEMGSADYAAEGASMSEEERRRMFDALEAEAEAARKREADADAEAERLVQARLAARSPAEIVVEEQCTLCHDAGNYTSAGHTLVGWLGVVLRMEWVNGAQLESGQRWMIGRHLAESHPAPPITAVIEVGGSIAFALVAPIGLWWWRRSKRHSRRRAR